MGLIPHISINEIINDHKQFSQFKSPNDLPSTLESDTFIVDESPTSYYVVPKKFLIDIANIENRLSNLAKKIKKNGDISALQSSARIAKYLQLPIRTPTVYECVQQMLEMKKKILDYENILKMFSDVVKLESFRLVEKQDKIRLVCDTSPRPRGIPKQIHMKTQESFKGNEFTSITEDLILRVYFFDPIRGSRIAGFDILATQTLADLKDSFVCLKNQFFNDYIMRGSCFLLNGTLYPDTRDPNAHDYDRELIDYLSKYNPKMLKSNTTIPQHKAVLFSMEIPIYTNGVYLHNGDCEHRFMFTSIRMVSKNDCTIKSVYPLCIYKPITRTDMCEICQKNPRKSLVFNCKLLVKNPMSLCTTCVDDFIHEDNKLLDPGTKIYKLE